MLVSGITDTFTPPTDVHTAMHYQNDVVNVRKVDGSAVVPGERIPVSVGTSTVRHVQGIPNTLITGNLEKRVEYFLHLMHNNVDMCGAGPATEVSVLVFWPPTPNLATHPTSAIPLSRPVFHPFALRLLAGGGVPIATTKGMERRSSCEHKVH